MVGIVGREEQRMGRVVGFSRGGYKRIRCQDGSRKWREKANGECTNRGQEEGRDRILEVVTWIDGGAVCRLW